jgi:FKBP-type peptidyl-prolyl cis-trans isomerase FkpA
MDFKTKKITFILVAALVFSVMLVGCKFIPNDEFTTTASGIAYKIITMGDSSYLPQQGDSVYLIARFKNAEGQLVFNSEADSYNGLIGLALTTGAKQGSLEEACTLISEGDSAVFKINANIIYNRLFNVSLPKNIKKGSLLTIEAYIYKIKTVAMQRKDSLSYKLWSNEMLAVENEQIKQYKAANKIDSVFENEGVIELKNEIHYGIPTQKTIFVRYKGMFLDGRVMDTNLDTEEAFEYKKGTPDQLLRGIEKTAIKMNKGDKMKVLLTSAVAFGAHGSSTGNVAPFTPLIYEIEVIK